MLKKKMDLCFVRQWSLTILGTKFQVLEWNALMVLEGANLPPYMYLYVWLYEWSF